MTLTIVQKASNWQVQPAGGPFVTWGATPGVGNLLIMFSTADATYAGTNGWTQLATSGGGRPTTPNIYYKYAGASEPTTALFATSNTDRDIASIGYEISGVTGTIGTDVQGSNIAANIFMTSTTCSGAVVTTTGSGLLLAFCCGCYNPGLATNKCPTSSGTDDITNTALSPTALTAQEPMTGSHKQYVGSGATAQLTYTFPTTPDQSYAQAAVVVINGTLGGGGETAAITTTLGGLKQTLNSTITAAAGITTTLKGMGQTLNAGVGDNGTIVTHLGGVGQQAVVKRISAPGTGRRVYWTS